MIKQIVEWIINLFKSKKITYLEEQIKQLTSQIKSINVLNGQRLEQLVPLSKDFPEGKFIFLGQPIDGIIFNDNEINLIEIKTGDSKLSQKQKRIKELVNQRKVNFLELRY